MTDFLQWWADHWPLVPIIIAVIALDIMIYRWLMIRAILKAFESVFGPPIAINGKPVKRKRGGQP